MLGVATVIPALSAGFKVDGRFCVEERLGPGNTYRGRDAQTGNAVALKVLAASVDAFPLDALREACAGWLTLEDLACPTSLGIFEEKEGLLRLAIQVRTLVEGVSLATRVAGGVLGEDEARKVAAGVLDALVRLGTRDPPLFHGDLTPTSLLLLPDGAVALADPGAVKAAFREAAAGALLGTGWTDGVDRSFAAPETMLGNPHPTSDLYGLGGVLLFAVTGRNPRDLPSGDPLERLLGRCALSPWFVSYVSRLREITVEGRFTDAAEALAVLRGNLPVQRAEAVKRRAPDAQIWSADPVPGFRRSWARQRVLLGYLATAPLVLGGMVLGTLGGQALPSWVGVAQIAVGVLAGLFAGWHLLFHVPKTAIPGDRRIGGWVDELRYSDGKHWRIIPYRKIARYRRSRGSLFLEGTWVDGAPSRVEIAPVYDRSIDAIVALIEEHRVATEAPPAVPTVRLPTPGLSSVILAGGVAVAALALVRIGEGIEPAGQRSGAQVASSVEDLDGLSVANGVGVAAGDPDDPTADVEALTAYNRSLRDVSAKITSAVPGMGGPGMGAEGAPAPGGEGATDAATPRTRPCPMGFSALTLSPGGLIPPACTDANGPMIQIVSDRPFLVDLTEVTSEKYGACVEADACPAPATDAGCRSKDGLLPARCVDRKAAAAYCAWAGRRLCTTAEWTEAARGPGGAPWPWGTEGPDCTRAVLPGRLEGGAEGPGCGLGGAWPVGARVAGIGVHGCLDLVGNVAEWVSDNPPRVLGGAWDTSNAADLRPETPRSVSAELVAPDVGLRCCRGL